jgi:two-component system osmolarity sensor histidine kinase EnvZ
MRWLPRSLFRQNLLLLVALILLGQLISALVFIFAVQQPRAVRLAGLAAQQVQAIQQAAARLEDGPRQAFLAAMNVGDEFRVLPAAALPLDRTEFAGFDEPDSVAVRGFLRRLRVALGERAQIVRWQASDRSIWVGILIGDDPYWVTLRGGQLLPVAPWLFLGLSAAATLLAILGAVGISRRINRPLARLVEAAQVMGKGERPPHLADDGPQEIATVAASFNQLADDLAALDRERAVMLAGVSHDLRTPLTKLRLALDISEARLEPALFAQMGRHIEEIDGLLDQFLAFARIGGDEVPCRCAIDPLVGAVAEAFIAEGVVLHQQLGAAVRLPVREKAIRRLLFNLLDNARKYGGGEVALVTRVDGGCCRIEVCDDGPGIAPQDVERLLQPFVRADAARAGKPGTGLGLAIVRRIVDLHGGKLELTPRGDGKPGLRVSVALPLAT